MKCDLCVPWCVKIWRNLKYYLCHLVIYTWVLAGLRVLDRPKEYLKALITHYQTSLLWKDWCLIPSHPVSPRALFVQPFLTDPSPIIGYPCQWLTDSLLFDIIDVPLAFEDINAKLLDVVSVANVDAKEGVDDRFWTWTFVKILKVRFFQDFEKQIDVI